VNRDQLVEYCLAKPGAEETYPWGEEELVAKVGGKGFAFIGPGSVSVKCGRDAAEAAEWRDRYPGAITSSHYVGRYGWNSVDLAGAVPVDDLRELVDASYDAAVAALPKSRRPRSSSD
jgi:predicted DNA-binding protein (MmcQ/YjbR family)